MILLAFVGGIVIGGIGGVMVICLCQASGRNSDEEKE